MKNFVKFPVQWGGLKIRVPDSTILCPVGSFTVPVLSPPRCLTLSGPAGPPGRPWLRWVHIRSGTSLLGAVRTLTRPQVVFRGPGPLVISD